MSKAATTSDSIDSNYNVLLAALGLTANERYVKDMDALVDKAEQAVKGIVNISGQRVNTVVVRGNYALQQRLEERLDDPALPDVEYYEIDWRRLLDDEPETYNGGEDQTQGVRVPDEEDVDNRPMAEIVAEHAEQVDVERMAEALGIVSDEFDPETDEFHIREHFDLSIREHRDEIPMAEVDQERINRAKARAMGKTDERLYNDWEGYDTLTVDAAVFLRDGMGSGEAAIDAAHGENPWVKFPSECDGPVLEVSANEDSDDIIDWERYLLETGEIEPSELTDGQEAALRERHSADDLAYMGLSVNNEAQSSTSPQPAGAD